MERTITASMQDVAREAGVSSQTVSRVANGSPAVREETRRKVEAAMERVGYRPNFAARALKHGRFKDIGVVLFNLNSFGNARVLSAIAAAADANGYSVTVQIMPTGPGRTLTAAVERMKQQPVDGVIVVLEEALPDLDGFTPPRDLPVVLVTQSADFHCPTVDTDQHGCSAAIVKYLLSKGHRTVHHISGPATSLAAQARAKGWRQTLEQAGATVPPLHEGDWEADSGYRIGLELAKDPTCTAVYASNDQMAYGAMLALVASGRRVPEDVSVVGVDDSLAGTVPQLGLTTMRIRFDAIGREAFRLIRSQCEGTPVPPHTAVSSEFVERSSAGAPQDAR